MGQFKDQIGKLMDQSDKESNRQQLMQVYDSLPDEATKRIYADDLAGWLEEILEKAKYLWLTNHNEDHY